MSGTTKSSFDESIAVITGGSRGIGRVIAETLAQRGATVVIADFRIELAKTTAQEIAEGRKKLPRRAGNERWQLKWMSPILSKQMKWPKLYKKNLGVSIFWSTTLVSHVMICLCA